jgi:hypothetical protein
MMLLRAILLSPRPAKRGEGAEGAQRLRRERGACLEKMPSPGSRDALATLSRCAGEGKGF